MHLHVYPFVCTYPSCTFNSSDRSQFVEHLAGQHKMDEAAARTAALAMYAAFRSSQAAGTLGASSSDSIAASAAAAASALIAANSNKKKK